MIINIIPANEQHPRLYILDKFVLLLYSWMLMYDFSRYVDSSQSHLYLEVYLLARILLLFVCIFKIVYYFNSNISYSIISILFIVSTFIYYYFKFDKNLVMFLSQFTIFLNLASVVVAAYGIRFDDILKTYLITIGLFLTMRVLLSFANILPNDRMESISRNGHMWNFGFGSHNTIFKYYIFIALSWFYVARNSSKKYLHSLIIALITLLLYYFTHSQVGTIVILSGCILYVLIDLLSKSQSKISRNILIIFKCLSVISPIMIIIITFIGGILYNYFMYANGYHKVNTMINRFRQFSMDLALHGIVLPWQNAQLASQYDGRRFNWLIGDSFLSEYCDNCVHSLLICYGAIALIVFATLFQMWAIQSFKQHNLYMLLIIGLLSIYCTMESPAYQLGWNPFLILPFTTTYHTTQHCINLSNRRTASCFILATILIDLAVIIITHYVLITEYTFTIFLCSSIVVGAILIYHNLFSCIVKTSG